MADWNGTPLVVYHPAINGMHVSARDPDILQKSGIGHVYRASHQGKLGAEAWFDEENTRRVDPRVHDALVAGRPMEISTGLFTDNIPAPPGSVFNGKPYDFTARNYKPDHVAILPDQVGACSLSDGCGLMVNERAPCGCEACRLAGLTGNAGDDNGRWVTTEDGQHLFLSDKGTLHTSPGGKEVGKGSDTGKAKEDTPDSSTAGKSAGSPTGYKGEAEYNKQLAGLHAEKEAATEGGMDYDKFYQATDKIRALVESREAALAPPGAENLYKWGPQNPPVSAGDDGNHLYHLTPDSRLAGILEKGLGMGEAVPGRKSLGRLYAFKDLDKADLNGVFQDSDVHKNRITTLRFRTDRSGWTRDPEFTDAGEDNAIMKTGVHVKSDAIDVLTKTGWVPIEEFFGKRSGGKVTGNEFASDEQRNAFWGHFKDAAGAPGGKGGGSGSNGNAPSEGEVSPHGPAPTKDSGSGGDSRAPHSTTPPEAPSPKPEQAPAGKAHPGLSDYVAAAAKGGMVAEKDILARHRVPVQYLGINHPTLTGLADAGLIEPESYGAVGKRNEDAPAGVWRYKGQPIYGVRLSAKGKEAFQAGRSGVTGNTSRCPKCGHTLTTSEMEDGRCLNCGADLTANELISNAWTDAAREASIAARQAAAAASHAVSEVKGLHSKAVGATKFADRKSAEAASWAEHGGMSVFGEGNVLRLSEESVTHHENAAKLHLFWGKHAGAAEKAVHEAVAKLHKEAATLHRDAISELKDRGVTGNDLGEELVGNAWTDAAREAALAARRANMHTPLSGKAIAHSLGIKSSSKDAKEHRDAQEAHVHAAREVADLDLAKAHMEASVAHGKRAATLEKAAVRGASKSEDTASGPKSGSDKEGSDKDLKDKVEKVVMKEQGGAPPLMDLIISGIKGQTDSPVSPNATGHSIVKDIKRVAAGHEPINSSIKTEHIERALKQIGHDYGNLSLHDFKKIAKHIDYPPDSTDLKHTISKRKLPTDLADRVHNARGFYRPENYDKVRDLPGGKELWAGANDWESGWTWAGIHDGGKDSEGYVKDPEKYLEVDHSDCPGCDGTLNAYGKTAKACMDHSKAAVESWAAKLTSNESITPPDILTRFWEHLAANFVKEQLDGRWVTLEGGQHVYIGAGGEFAPHGPRPEDEREASERRSEQGFWSSREREIAAKLGQRSGGGGGISGAPKDDGSGVASETGRSGGATAGKGGDPGDQSAGAGSARRVASVEEANSKLNRFEKFFRDKGEGQVADWVAKVRDHVNTVGTEAAYQSLAQSTPLGATATDRDKPVQYWGVGTEEANWKNMGHFMGAYLARNGITAVTGDTTDPNYKVISALGKPDRYVAGQDFKPKSDAFKNKLEESKHLPGLEKSEDISKLMGKPVTHLTQEVTDHLDKVHGKGQWIVKSYGDEAAAGYGIFFPQRAAAIAQDARNTVWTAGEHLDKYGFKVGRNPDTGEAFGVIHKSGDIYQFGTKEYKETIQGDARHWADKVAAAAANEKGAKLPEGSFMVQPAFKAVGISDADRAAGKTWHESNEGRVHLVTKPNGDVDVIPHSTWLKGGNLPVVFENDDTRAMARAAREAIAALPPEARKGQVYAPDVMKTENGYKVVELNAQGDHNGSGYLHDNHFTIDSYTSHLAGRAPAHVAFIRSILETRRKGPTGNASGAPEAEWLLYQFWNWLTDNAVPNQPRSQVTGYYKRPNAGTGKGEAHEAAQRGGVHISMDDVVRGADAGAQAEAGHNPPNWAVDEDKWEKAKAAADKGDYDKESGQYWAVVSHIYQNMGGKIEGKSKGRTNNEESASGWTGPGLDFDAANVLIGPWDLLTNAELGDASRYPSDDDRVAAFPATDGHDGAEEDRKTALAMARSGIARKSSKDRQSKEHAKAADAHREAQEAHERAGNSDKAAEHGKAASEHDARSAQLAHHAIKNPTHNLYEGDDMDRNGAISFLVTNCDCWKNDRETLNKLSDAKLKDLAMAAKRARETEAVANAAMTGFKNGEHTFVFNASAMKFIKSKTDPSAQAPLTECAEDDKDCAEREAMEAAKRGKAGTPYPPTMPATNTNGATHMTEQEWLAAMPLAWQATLNHAREIETREKDALIHQLRGHLPASDFKTRMVANDRKKDLATLRDEVAAMPPQQVANVFDQLGQAPAPERNPFGISVPGYQPAAPSAPNYAGAAGGPAVNTGRDDPEDILELPTTNWADVAQSHRRRQPQSATTNGDGFSD